KICLRTRLLGSMWLLLWSMPGLGCLGDSGLAVGNSAQLESTSDLKPDAGARSADPGLRQEIYVLGPHQSGHDVFAALQAGQTPESLGLRPAQDLSLLTPTLEDFERKVLAQSAQATVDWDTPIAIGECTVSVLPDEIHVSDRHNVCFWTTLLYTQFLDEEPT